MLDNVYNYGLSQDVYKTSSRLLMNHAEMEYSEPEKKLENLRQKSLHLFPQKRIKSCAMRSKWLKMKVRR